MSTFSRIKTWVSNEVLTADDLNNEFDNIITNMDPPGIEDASANVSAMQSTVNPGGLGTESLATSLLGEIQRLRYTIARMVDSSLTKKWYENPIRSFAAGDLNVLAGDIEDDAVITSKILDRNVTGVKIALATVALENLAPDAIFNYALKRQTFTSDGSFVVPAGVTNIIVSGYGGGGGGGGAGAGSGGPGTNTGGGSGGGGAPYMVQTLDVTPGESLTVVIGPGGTGGSGGAGVANGSPGFLGGDTSVSGGGGSIFFRGGLRGLGGLSTANGGAPGAQVDNYLSSTRNGAGGAAGAAGSAGENGVRAAGGAGGASSGVNSGGGGGGGGACGSAGGAGGAGDGGGGNAGLNAGAGSGAGGGGASGVGTAAASGAAGGNGGSGLINIQWVDLV